MGSGSQRVLWLILFSFASVTQCASQVFPSNVAIDRCVAPSLNYDATDISPQISYIYTSPFTSSCSGRVVGYWFCYQNSSTTTGARVTIATVLLLEDMGENYHIVRSFTVEAIPGEDSCLPGRSGDRQCCVLRNLTAEDQFGVNPSYLYGLVIPERTNLLDGPDVIQTHSSIGYGYRFNSIQYREPLVKHDLGIASMADPTAQQVKLFQFIIDNKTSVESPYTDVTPTTETISTTIQTTLTANTDDTPSTPPSITHPSDEEQTSIFLPIVIIISTVLLMLACIVLVILSTKYQRIARKQVDAAQHEHPDSIMNVTHEHFEMCTNDAYITLNAAEIATTWNGAHTASEHTGPASQTATDGQVLPGTDGCYDYVDC